METKVSWSKKERKLNYGSVFWLLFNQLFIPLYQDTMLTFFLTGGSYCWELLTNISFNTKQAGVPFKLLANIDCILKIQHSGTLALPQNNSPSTEECFTDLERSSLLKLQPVCIKGSCMLRCTKIIAFPVCQCY